MRRTAGRRLAAEARNRRAELVRERRWFFVGTTAGFVALAVAMTLFMDWLGGRGWGIFMAGALIGMFVTSALFLFRYVDPVGARIQSGFDGEYNTADQLRRLRRHGWKVVHNLHLEDGDIDHVAIGPGGVIAIETKSSSADWRFLESQGAIRKWAKQAERSAFRARHLVKQVAGVETDPIPYLVTWVHGQPDDDMEIGRVIRVRGSNLSTNLRGLVPALSANEVQQIADALEAFGARLDKSAGFETRWWQRLPV